MEPVEAPAAAAEMVASQWSERFRREVAANSEELHAERVVVEEAAAADIETDFFFQSLPEQIPIPVASLGGFDRRLGLVD
jgi:hypothetical protein